MGKAITTNPPGAAVGGAAILAVGDEVDERLLEDRLPESLQQVRLLLSCGDLPADYLEALYTHLDYSPKAGRITVIRQTQVVNAFRSVRSGTRAQRSTGLKPEAPRKGRLNDGLTNEGRVRHPANSVYAPW